MIPRLKPVHGILAPAACFCVLLLTAAVALRAQTPVFADTPDNVIRFIAAANPQMPVETSHGIAVIESNAPAYLAASDKMETYYRLNRLIALEGERLKPVPDLRRYWYEFIRAKAAMLREDQIDAVAWDWWNAMEKRAIVHQERGGHDEPRDASFAEVCAHFQTLRTGSEAQATEAVRWLQSAQSLDGWNRLRPLPGTEEFSPLAHLLARDISQELTMYVGADAVKLRDAVKKLVTGKFRISAEDGSEHVLAEEDVDRLLDAFSSDEEERRRVLQMLEEWLKRAIDADLNRVAQDSRVNRAGGSH